MRLHQVLCAAGPVDAVTNQALAWRTQFKTWGWEGEDFTALLAPGVRGLPVRRLHELHPADGDLVLVHHSGYGRDLERLFAGPARTLLISHNVTPAEWFWPYDPVEGVRCHLGREQLNDLSRRADRLAGVSEYNAQELREASGRDAAVIPVLFDPTRLGAAAPRGDEGVPRGGSRLLFVGRLTPHKRHDLLIRALVAYRQIEPDASLTLVGGAMSPSYGARLRELVRELAPGAVSFRSGLSLRQLADCYRAADVFLCLSEHEGFCIPLLEAFHFGLPVVARNAAAVGEVVGDAGVLLDGQDDLATVARVLAIVAHDEQLRHELRARAARRLEAYDPSTTAQLMRSELQALRAS